MAQYLLTPEELRARLHYEPETGVFTWRDGRRAGQSAGGVTGPDRAPCIGIGINHGFYKAHRLAFLWMLGRWPTNFVDHCDGNSLNNRWANLRECTNAENIRNGKARGGVCRKKGVTREAGAYRARIVVDGKAINLGRHTSREAAHEAYRIAARKYHGEFARFD